MQTVTLQAPRTEAKKLLRDALATRELRFAYWLSVHDGGDSKALLLDLCDYLTDAVLLDGMPLVRQVITGTLTAYARAAHPGADPNVRGAAFVSATYAALAALPSLHVESKHDVWDLGTILYYSTWYEMLPLRDRASLTVRTDGHAIGGPFASALVKEILPRGFWNTIYAARMRREA